MPDMHSTLQRLEIETREAVNMISNEMQSSKGTGISYTRHLRSYEDLWAIDQQTRASKTQGYVTIPAHPITPAKATVFLLNEMVREKVSIPLLW